MCLWEGRGEGEPSGGAAVVVLDCRVESRQGGERKLARLFGRGAVGTE